MFQITDLQLALLRVLWDRGEATVAEVHEGLSGRRRLAASTVATLLARLEKRGLIAHRTDGRRHVYRPQVSELEVRTAVLDTVREGVFGGDLAALLTHLLDGRSVDRGDIERVRKLLDQMEADVEETQ